MNPLKTVAVSGHWRLYWYRVRKVVAASRTYFFLCLCSMLLFIIVGLAGMIQQSYSVSPVQTMKGLAASVSGRFFESMLGAELPHLPVSGESSPYRSGKLASFFVRLLTDLNPDDPRSLLAFELPGASLEPSILLRPGSGGDDEGPEDRGPSAGVGQDLSPSPHPSGADSPPVLQAGQPDLRSPVQKGSTPPASQPDDPDASEADEIRHKAVLIYHSHNRESWLPELDATSKDPSDSKINITLVGKRLANQLEARGVGALHSSTDYATTVKSYQWNASYKYSLETVRQAMAENPRLQYFFDIHRDSQRRSKTTATINGVDYAQVYFIIGHKNPDWKKNEAFASRIHEKLEQRYPGLSRGIWGKSAANGNGEYNQSVSTESVLIEIGGIENTLRECYRTADALAEVIAEIYWESQNAQAVSGQADGQ
jgi:stage II sporulation protein P